MSKKIHGIPVSTPLNPAKINPVVPDDKLANAVTAYMAANPVTPSGIGARPDTWTPTSEEVGAAPASHAEDKNNPHSVTIAQIGAAPATHAEAKDNPHAVTAAQVGLGNVNNTSDKDKPVSTAQAAAIADAKKAGTDAQTAAGNAHTAANNAKTSADNAQTAADNAQNSADNAQTAIDTHKEDKENPHGVTAAQVGATTMTLLWENASPNSAFAGQTINLDLSGYDHALIEFCLNPIAWQIKTSAWYRVDAGESIVSVADGHPYTYLRGVTVNTNNVTFGTGRLGNTENNNNLVPLRIYGLKGVTK